MDNLVSLQAQKKAEAEADSHLTAAQNASKTRRKSMKLQSDKRDARKVHPFPSGRGRDAIDEPNSAHTVLVVAAIPYTVRISYYVNVRITDCIVMYRQIRCLTKDLTKGLP